MGSLSELIGCPSYIKFCDTKVFDTELIYTRVIYVGIQASSREIDIKQLLCLMSCLQSPLPYFRIW